VNPSDSFSAVVPVISSKIAAARKSTLIGRSLEIVAGHHFDVGCRSAVKFALREHGSWDERNN
jgi:hypothetical protein